MYQLIFHPQMTQITQFFKRGFAHVLFCRTKNNPRHLRHLRMKNSPDELSFNPCKETKKASIPSIYRKKQSHLGYYMIFLAYLCRNIQPKTH